MARTLLERRLAGCVSIVPAVESHYRWQGEIHRDPEAFLWIKTRADLAERALEVLRTQHSYDVPVISVIAVEAVTEQTREWLESIQSDDP